MGITQRKAVILALGILIGGSVVLFGVLLLNQNWIIAAVVGAAAITDAVLLAAYLRGWRYVPHALVITAVFIAAFVTEIVPFSNGAGLPLSLLIPTVLALALTNPAWVMVSASLTVALYIGRVLAAGLTLNIFYPVIYAIIVGVLLLARAVLDTAVRQADEARKRAEAAQMQAEEQARALEAANAAQQAQLEEQRRLLDLVATLEIPALTLTDGVLFAPIVGNLDSRRSALLTARLLEAAHDQRAHHVIIDISGVSTVDTVVAQALIQTAQALRLLGCRVTLSGISSNVALTLTQQNIQLSDITTVRSPQEALMARYA